MSSESNIHSESPPTANSESKPSLKRQFITSSSWTLIGYGAAQVIRFGNNLVLTRLLSPEVFGVMALLQSIISSLNYVTDIGIGPSIIQNKKGDDPKFLGTAWTIQIVRNAVIWAACCLLAWPATWFYNEPEMLYALPVAGLPTLLGGFLSINIFLQNKNLKLGSQTILDLGSQIVAVASMIAIAFYSHTIWSLLIGTILGTVFKTILSHWMLEGPKVQLGIDRELASSMFRFSRWITISTMITFFLSQGDRLILGRLYTDKAYLGIYSIGYLIPQTATVLIGHIAHRVLFPIYSRLVAEGGSDLHRQVRKISHGLVFLLLPPLLLLMLFSQNLVNTLYPLKYHTAGWIMRLFAATAAIEMLTALVGPVLLATGNSLATLKLNIFKLIAMASLSVIGYKFGGIDGLIVAFAAVPLASYPFYAWFAWNAGTWFPWLDLAALSLTLGVLALGWQLGM